MNLGEKLICQELTSLLLEASEAAAIATKKLVGMGLKNEADGLAVKAMRDALNASNFGIKVVIGEGEMDEAPMLFIGEKLGKGKHGFDLAVDPLEGTNLCANNMPNSITAIAISEADGFLKAPDCYMEKIASGRVKEDGVLNIEAGIKENLKNLASYLKKPISDLEVVLLARPRHQETIAKIREAGAKVNLISDGDIYGIIATTAFGNGADLYVGMGGAPEGVLAAAALNACGGFMQGRLVFEAAEQRKRAIEYGLKQPEKILNLKDMVSKNSIFVVSGVTNGEMLKAPKMCKKTGFLMVESMVFSSISKKGYVQKITNYLPAK